MKRIVIALVAALTFGVVGLAIAQKEIYTMLPTQSAWHKNQIDWFEAKGYSKDRVAFQRPFAWGTGTYLGRRFEWFAHSNTDAYLQFNLSVRLADKDLKKIAETRDQYNRNWDTTTRDMHGPGTATWIGASNDWVDTACVKPNYRPCDGKKVVDGYVAEMNKRLHGRLNLWVAGYLQ